MWSPLDSLSLSLSLSALVSFRLYPTAGESAYCPLLEYELSHQDPTKVMSKLPHMILFRVTLDTTNHNALVEVH